MNKKLVILAMLALVLTTGCFKQKEQNLDLSEFNVKKVETRTDEENTQKTNENTQKKHDDIKDDNNTIKEKDVEIEPNNEQILPQKDEGEPQIIDENGTTEQKEAEIKLEAFNAQELKYKKLRGEIEDTILDTEMLEKEDNTRYSWWLRLNNNHQVSGIDPYAEKILDDYKIVYAGDTSQKKVYLTFDEGYENGYTPKILDTLKENNAKAIFFITGSYLKRNTELVRRMLDEGHKVGSHSVNHPSFPDIASKNYEKLEKEMLDLEKDFYDEFGIGFSYIRPPRGEYSKRTLMAANQLGYKNVFWSYAYKDYDVNDQKGTDYAYNRVMDHLHNGMVVLLHAVSKDNANALDKMIKDIRAQGYEICAFDL